VWWDILVANFQETVMVKKKLKIGQYLMKLLSPTRNQTKIFH